MKRMLALLLTPLAFLAFAVTAGPASAAPPERYVDSGCSDWYYEPLVTCYEIDVRNQLVETGDGYLYKSRGTATFTVIDSDGTVVAFSTGASRYSHHIKRDEVKQLKISDTGAYGDTTFTCTYDLRLHERNGTLVQYKHEFTCV